MTRINPRDTEYRGVRLPDNIRKGQATGFSDDPYVVGWKDGVDAHYARTLERMTERDKHADKSSPPDVSAFVAITEDSPNGARAVIRTMSGKDRAVLSFYLHELSRVLEEEEQERTALVRLGRGRTRTLSDERVHPDER